MYKYKIELKVNGIRTETTITAKDAFYARKIVEAEYAGNKVVIIRVTKIQ